jgi:hypothetical protein
MGAFHFSVLSTLRAQQLVRGCRPRVEGIHKKTVIAQIEVAEGKVKQLLCVSADAIAPVARPEIILEDALAVVDAV